MLSDIIGQNQAVATLKSAAADERLPGTYLFVGPESVGKSATALALAQTLNCTDASPGDACGECYACRAIASGAHPDVRTAAPMGPSRVLRIGQFWPRDGSRDLPADRAMLRDIHFAPARGKKRVFIIEDADALNLDTANSLLKMLEEPPPYALFVLTATSEATVLPTIASRSQTVRFRGVAQAEIEAALRVRYGLAEDASRFIAAYSEGKIGLAMRLASQPNFQTARSAILDIAADLSSGAPPIQAFKIADELRKASDKFSGGKDESGEEKSQRIAITRALDLLALWFGDLMRIASAPQTAQPANLDRSSQLHKHAAHYMPDALRRATRIVLDTRQYVERNANAQIALETMALQILTLPRTP